MENEARLCLDCGKPLKGRLDKKFCDDYCRNSYNNKQNSDQNNFVRNINHILRKNRRILTAILPEGEEMKKVTKEKLLLQGFNLQYHTHTYQTQKGLVYTFCYEYGYLPLENDWYLIVRRKEK